MGRGGFRFQSMVPGLGQPLTRFLVQANGIGATTTVKKSNGQIQTGPPVQPSWRLPVIGEIIFRPIDGRGSQLDLPTRHLSKPFWNEETLFRQLTYQVGMLNSTEYCQTAPV